MSTIETISLALLAIVQLLTLVIHQILSQRRHQKTIEQIRSLRPTEPDTPRELPLRLCQNCFHLFNDHANGSNFIGGPCNLCACSAFVR